MYTFKHIGYRIFQFFLSATQRIVARRLPLMLKGPNSVLELPALIKSEGVSRVLIVAGKVLLGQGAMQPLFDKLTEAGIAYAVFDGVEPNPSIECIEAARELYIKTGAQALLPFGGGSSMDCAKACGARIARPNKSISQLHGTLRVLRRLPPIYAVPTTAGSGSEATMAAVVTDRATRHKYSLNDPVLIPHCAVLDPLLTVGMPQKLTVTTGMDALTHAIEAYLNRSGSGYARALSLNAVKLIFLNLEAAFRDGGNVQARESMLLASFDAGAAISCAGVGYVHAIAHTLGGLYNVAHGLANAVLLPQVLSAYGPAIRSKLSYLADAVGIPGADAAEKAAAFIEHIRSMNRMMDIPDTLDVIRDEDIPLMIDYALREANPLYAVPVIWEKEELYKVIKR